MSEAVNGGGARTNTSAENGGAAKNTQKSTPKTNANGAGTEPEAKDKEGPCGLPSKCSIL